jgi:hypothetical protein
MATSRYRFSAYDQLSFVTFPNYPHDLPTRKYLKRLPQFTSKLGVSTEDHLTEFLRVLEDFDVEHEGVVMMMFVPTSTRGRHERGTNPF